MWDPGAIHDPGLNANYRRGRVSRQCNKAHFTVGRDSRALIRDRGLATYLFPKFGRRIQFAPIDAVCSDSCEWGDEGPGFEVERMGWHEPFTADQTREVGEALRFSNAVLGIPLDSFHDGARLPIGSPFRGTVNHGSLIHNACDMHSDGWTRGEFNAAIGATGGSLIPAHRKDDMFIICETEGKKRNGLICGGFFLGVLGGKITDVFGVPVRQESRAWTDRGYPFHPVSSATFKYYESLGTPADLRAALAG